MLCDYVPVRCTKQLKTYQYIAMIDPSTDCAGAERAPGNAVRMGSGK